MIHLEFLAGLALLYLGGEVLLRGAVSLARRLGVSTFLIGITIVGFGTSVPELITCIEAALSGSPGIAIGNVVGSNITNFLLILGVMALLHPVVCDPKALTRDGLAMAVSGILGGWILLTSGALNRLTGGLLVSLMLVYIIYAFINDRKKGDAGTRLHIQEAESIPVVPGGSIIALPAIIAGIGLMIWGADLLVNAAIDIALIFGIPQWVIGLSVVAFGTSLPELATAFVAGLRGQGQMALGNILGSNIYNILAVLGITALVHPLTIPADMATLDIWVMLAATVCILMICLFRHNFSRMTGGCLLSSYGLYIAHLASRHF